MWRSLIVFILLVVPGASGAATGVVGLGDSITSTTFDPFPDGSYLDHLGPGYLVEDQGVPANLTEGILSRLETWLDAGNTTDVVIILAGTVDTVQAPGFFGGEYVEETTVANIQSMIELLLAANISVLVASPPPVEYPCDGVEAGGGPMCAEVDQRLANLVVALDALASSIDVPFVDLYDSFSNKPVPLGDLLLSDGLHPNVAGDLVIASAFSAPLQDIASPPVVGAVPALSPVGLALLGVGLAVAAAARREGSLS